MIEIHGNPISPGAAVGNIYVYEKKPAAAVTGQISGALGEEDRFDRAMEALDRKFDALYEEAYKKAGEEEAEIFAVHSMLAKDEEYSGAIRRLLASEGVTSEEAIKRVSEELYEKFMRSEDELIKERAGDIKDIADELTGILNGSNAGMPVFTEPVVIMAEELSPSETVSLDKKMIRGIVTFNGTPTSHAAILARSMGIPAVSGINVIKEEDGAVALINGDKGCLILEPDEEHILAMEEEIRAREEEAVRLRELKDKESITKSGKKINLYANVNGLDELKNCAESGAEGIGLFRSEFLYLKEKTEPSEERQFEIYKNAAVLMNGKEVIIRTLDAGADKQPDFLKPEKEDNPALGVRGIRLSLLMPEVFKRQLRAILRASAFGKLSVMFPLISTMDELKRAKDILKRAKKELTNEGMDFDKDIRCGIMIETPSAAMISDELAKEVDFFSIGTNDLIQYTAGADRQNVRLSGLNDVRNPAVMKLIKMTAENAHKAGISVSVCGEAASDPDMTGEFINMGMDGLSVSASMILKIRDKIINGDH